MTHLDGSLSVLLATRKLPVLRLAPVSLLAAALLTGCGKKDASSGGDAPSPTTDKGASAPPSPPLPAGAPAAIKPVAQPIGTSPVQAVLKSAKTDHDSYLMTFDFTNKGAKEVKAVAYTGCTYDKSGKKVGSDPQNGVDVDVKPNGKGEANIWLGKQSEAPAMAAIAVRQLKFADGTLWNGDPMLGCPATVKP